MSRRFRRLTGGVLQLEHGHEKSIWDVRISECEVSSLKLVKRWVLVLEKDAAAIIPRGGTRLRKKLHWHTDYVS